MRNLPQPNHQPRPPRLQAQVLPRVPGVMAEELQQVPLLPQRSDPLLVQGLRVPGRKQGVLIRASRGGEPRLGVLQLRPDLGRRYRVNLRQMRGQRLPHLMRPVPSRP